MVNLMFILFMSSYKDPMECYFLERVFRAARFPQKLLLTANSHYKYIYYSSIELYVQMQW